jgi:anti-sigma regulatory factor (Ser/Thr protein kinase)
MDAAGTSGLSVRLAADPVSVPGARRFAVEGASAVGYADLGGVAEMVVSELAGNAALHSAARFMYVSLHDQDGGVRVAVEDDGAVGMEAIVPSAPLAPDADEWEEQATTGRGLAIVSMLASEWGVEATGRGKRVWADLDDPDAVNEVRSPKRDAAAAHDVEPRLPPGWVLVRLAQCPVVLSLRADQHLDELVRELQLLSADHGNERSQALAAEIRDLLASPAHARLTGKRIAEEARAHGLEHVDIEMAMPREFGPLVLRLQDAVSRADELCRANELLTLASPDDIRELRAWMTDAIVTQVEGAPPVTWEQWLSRRTRA